MSRPRAPDRVWPVLVLFVVILALVFVPFHWVLALAVITPLVVLAVVSSLGYKKDEY